METTVGAHPISKGETISVRSALAVCLIYGFPRLYSIICYRYKPGDFVLCQFEGSWSRAEVCHADASSLQVIFIDYGNKHTAPLSAITPLPKQFSKLPKMAVKVRLHGLADSPSQAIMAQAAQHIKVGGWL